MSLWVVIATGQSLKREDVEYVRGKANIAAVNNAYQLAPWADILVSHDRAWWAHHKDAMEFAGRKFCRFQHGHCEKYTPEYLPLGCNSGLMAMFIAKELGASKILMLGFDMHGTHYFGPHPQGLKNPVEHSFVRHMRQFTRFDGPEVINCTPDSALKMYPHIPLREVL